MTVDRQRPPPSRGASEAPLERDLLARARSGDPEAFRVIFDRHAPSVRRFLGDVLRDDSAADEAVQETFVRAHGKLAGLRDDEKLEGFLFGIARRVSLEQLRLRQRDRKAQPDDEKEQPQIDRSPTPEAALLSSEAQRVLDGALTELSEDRRTALVLRLDHWLGYDQIALAMGWTPQKVKNEIHRARLQLRTRLAGYLEEA